MTGPVAHLRPGVEMPLLGLGVWRIPADETAQAVAWALEAGYRHIDTAAAYGNERGVGEGIRASGLPREEVFVTTKLLPGAGPPHRQLRRSLELLGLERVDLYLIHSPRRGGDRLWPEVERLHDAGLARAVGVSNFGDDLLRRTVAGARVPPAANQIEWHPEAWSPARAALHRDLGVVLESYSPLGHGGLLGHPAVADVAARAGRTAAQVLVRWCVERGTPTIPKSRSRERIVENAGAFGWELGPEALARLDALARL